MNRLILTFVLFIFVHSINGQSVNFEIKVFLEGAFNGIDMNTDLNDAGIIPLNQPYNNEPWSYDGTESISAPAGSDIVDWVLLELRETDGDSSTTTPAKFIDQQAALLLSDGSIVQPNGISLLNYVGNITQNLYIIVYHRNHLPVMSASPLVKIGDTYEYDFTDALSKAYLDGQKSLSGGMFGLIGGNSDGNRAINSNDIDIYWSNDAGKTGYYGGDSNMDTEVNNMDKNDIWETNKDFNTPVTMSCGVISDYRDGKIYHSVLLGDQCWMVTNLNIGTMINGINDQIDNDTIEKYCYNDDTIYCNTYGGLYQWNEVMEYVTTQGVKGICPIGWHIPTEVEWNILVDCVAGGIPFGWQIAGGKMKSTGTTAVGTGYWSAPNEGATNESGFAAHPAGFRSMWGNTFQALHTNSNIWSSTEFASGTNAKYSTMNSVSNSIHTNNGYLKEFGFSVRCLKD